jgi:hypothetical protein
MMSSLVTAPQYGGAAMSAGTYRAPEPIGVFQMLVLAKGHFRTSRLPGAGGLGGGLEPGGGGAGMRTPEVLQAISTQVIRIEALNFTRCSAASSGWGQIGF